MSWLSDVFSGDSPQVIAQPTQDQVANYYRTVKQNNPVGYELIKAQDPAYIAEQQAQAFSRASTPDVPAPRTVAPTGPQVALKQLNDVLGSDFESRFEPSTVGDPFVQSALTSGRSKADEFISNMLRRGTLTESGRAGAIDVLNRQTPTVQSRLGGISTGLLTSDRARLTELANAARGTAQQTQEGTEFDPTPLVNQIASAGQSQAGTFGARFNASLPPGDLFDVSGVAEAGGGVTGPRNIQFDPYAQEGGKLTTGLSDTGAPPPSSSKRRTSVF
jgi:hypothetical protein